MKFTIDNINSKYRSYVKIVLQEDVFPIILMESDNEIKQFSSELLYIEVIKNIKLKNGIN